VCGVGDERRGWGLVSGWPCGLWGGPGVADPPLGQTPFWGEPAGWGRVPFIGRGTQQQRRYLFGAEANVFRGAPREADLG
jgi:hypothetical protein